MEPNVKVFVRPYRTKNFSDKSYTPELQLFGEHCISIYTLLYLYCFYYYNTFIRCTVIL